MQSNTNIKRGTTPELPITIETPCENIKHIDFIFKKDKNEKAPKLLEKSFNIVEEDSDNGKIIKAVNVDSDGIDATIEVSGEYFVINVPFDENDTRKLPKGTVFMDTGIVYTNNIIPTTEIVELDILETLFSEVFNK